MALITRFNRHARDQYRTHDPIEADYYVLERDGKPRLLQIDTRGRQTREKSNKLSQTIQLDQTSALALFKILKTTFGFN